MEAGLKRNQLHVRRWQRLYSFSFFSLRNLAPDCDASSAPRQLLKGDGSRKNGSRGDLFRVAAHTLSIGRSALTRGRDLLK
jgi:hypothetical protein